MSIAAALNSDDLTHYERPCDADTLRALGLTAINRSLGVLILEAREACAGDSHHDSARLRDLAGAVANVCRRQADRDKLRVDQWAVAWQLVRELLLDCCSKCQGRGFLPLSYGPDQANERGMDCPVCLGSGKAKRDLVARARAVGTTYDNRIARYFEAVESRLVEAEINALDQYRRRLTSRD